MHVEDIDTYVQDVIHHIEMMKNEYPHLPCILIGHSMVNVYAKDLLPSLRSLFFKGTNFLAFFVIFVSSHSKLLNILTLIEYVHTPCVLEHNRFHMHSNDTCQNLALISN